MSLTHFAHAAVPETFYGPGYELSVLRARDRVEGGIAIGLRGGLGDGKSNSMEPLAEDLFEVSDHEAIVYIVRGEHPTFPLFAAIGALQNARDERSKGMHVGENRIVEKFRPDISAVLGDSEGGVTVTDAQYQRIITSTSPQPPKERFEPRARAVFTVDSPGVDGPLEDMGVVDIVRGLYELASNISRDLRLMSFKRKFDMIWAQFRHPPSIYEPLYMLGEIEYLRYVDISGELADLQTLGHMSVWNVFHEDDLVKGAERTAPNRIVFSGGHGAVVANSQPIAKAVLANTYSVYEGLSSTKAA